MNRHLWVVVFVLLTVAVGAGVAEYRRARRRDLDRIGMISWPLMQMLALMGALIAAAGALFG